jgi:hypothetical protein
MFVCPSAADQKAVRESYVSCASCARAGLDDLFMGLCRRILEDKGGKAKGEGAGDNKGESLDARRNRTASKTGQQKTPRKETVKLETPQTNHTDKHGSHEKTKRKCILF